MSVLMLNTGCSLSNDNGGRTSQTGFAFDTVINITVNANGADEAVAHCFDMAEYYEKLFSVTIEDSDIARINKAAPEFVEVAPETVEIVEKGLEYGKYSEGAFSICSYALTSLWDFHAENPVAPNQASIEVALPLVGDELIELKGNKIRVKIQGAGIDLGGIAKGYIADKMKEYLVSEGYTSGVINLGGNVITLGPKNTSDGIYKIGIQKPFSKDGTMADSVEIKEAAVVTSGNYQRYFYENDKLYHHILDLKTGYPAEGEVASVTVICDEATLADVMSTTFFIKGTQWSENFCEKMDGIDVKFVVE